MATRSRWHPDTPERTRRPLPTPRGRGLFLVSALSARWNWYLTQQPEGKVVWCELEDERPGHGAIDRSAGQSCLPRRIPGAVQARPAAASHDPAVLRRLRDGLATWTAHSRLAAPRIAAIGIRAGRFERMLVRR